MRFRDNRNTPAGRRLDRIGDEMPVSPEQLDREMDEALRRLNQDEAESGPERNPAA